MRNKINDSLSRAIQNVLPPQHILSKRGKAAIKHAFLELLSSKTACDPRQLLGRILVASQRADVNPDVIRKIEENVAILMTHQLDQLYNKSQKKQQSNTILPNRRPR